MFSLPCRSDEKIMLLKLFPSFKYRSKLLPMSGWNKNSAVYSGIIYVNGNGEIVQDV